MLLHNDFTRTRYSLSITLLAGLIATVNPVLGQSLLSAQRTERPAPPTRDPNTAGYVTAKELPDGSIPPANADGNFIIGPTHNAAPEVSAQNGVPHGTVIEFTMNSSDSKIYPGIARDAEHVRNRRSRRPREARGDHKPSRSLHAEGGRLCPQAVRRRQRRAFHRRRGRA